MLSATMATPKSTTRKPATKPRAVKPKAPEPRPNVLAEVASEAQRAALLEALETNDWNLSATAEALRLHAASAVIRYIHALGLADEYEKARARGAVKPGPRP